MIYVVFKQKNRLIFIIALVAIFITVSLASPTYNLMDPISNPLQKIQEPTNDPKKPKEKNDNPAKGDKRHPQRDNRSHHSQELQGLLQELHLLEDQHQGLHLREDRRHQVVMNHHLI